MFYDVYRFDLNIILGVTILKKFKISLASQILIGLVLGIAVGAIFYGNANVQTYLQPIGDIFLNLIKMIVVPIIVSTLIVGVAGTGDMKQLGRLGGKTLIYFEIITTVDRKSVV